MGVTGKTLVVSIVHTKAKKELKPLNQLLNNKLTGEINQFEETEFQNWLKESSDNELHYRRMHDAWVNDKRTPWVKGQKSTFERISKQLDFEENINSNETRVNTTSWKVWHKMTAVIALVLGMTAVFYTTVVLNQPNEMATTEMVHKINPAGQKTRISLPDGSVCWLNSESEISYLPNFVGDKREIHIKGEAYFEVAKDAKKPFDVHTPTMVITALGTAFNVSSFPNSSTETVALIEGKIAVKCENDFYPAVLPGEAVSFNKTSLSSIKKPVVEDYSEWKDGVLRFDEANYQTILLKLERWYGVNLTVVGTPPSDLRYKAIFKDEILTNILESMKYGHDFEFEIDGKNVKIMFN